MVSLCLPHATTRHEPLRQQVRAFAEGVIGPHVAAMDTCGQAPEELIRQVTSQPWIGVTIPRRYGGMEAGHVARTIVIEEISRVSGAMGATVQALILGTAKILHFGTTEQKQRWLPLIARGECLPTIAVTEDDSGGDVLGMSMTATRDGDHYVLSGTKRWVGCSDIGDLHGVVAWTDQDAGKNGLSAFLVEADREGVAVGQQAPSMGLRGFTFGTLHFRGCRVPAANLLGEREGIGLQVAHTSSVTYGRLCLGAVALGLHQAMLEETVHFSTSRLRRGRPMYEIASVHRRIAAIRDRLDGARLAAYYAADLLDTGHPCDPELMRAKLIGYESAMTSAKDALEAQGARGLLIDNPVQRLMRDVPHIFAPAGTSDVQALRLADDTLGIKNRTSWSSVVVQAERAGI